MKCYLASVVALAMAVSGCANLTPQEQTNLENELALGKMFVKGVGTIYCEYEPVTASLIGVWDTSAHTGTVLAKLNASNAAACPLILGTTPIPVTPPASAVPVAVATTN